MYNQLGLWTWDRILPRGGDRKKHLFTEFLPEKNINSGIEAIKPMPFLVVDARALKAVFSKKLPIFSRVHATL